jgi:ArsR family transcriptional regulator, cadmium/lead-responsive transcriptional repressor
VRRKDGPPEAVFSALADPTRRELMTRLTERGPATASDLARELPISRQAIAKHFVALEEAGLVKGERVGREHRYHLTPGPLTDAISWMATIGAAWDERLSWLRQLMARRTAR